MIFFLKENVGGLLGEGGKGNVGPLSNYCPPPPPPPLLPELRWLDIYLRSFGLTKTILQDTVQGKRRNGRQKKRWEDYGVDRDGLC